MKKSFFLLLFSTLLALGLPLFSGPLKNEETERKIEALLARMTLEEKIGQMIQLPGAEGREEAIRSGRVGSLLNVNEAGTVNRLQRIAVEEARNGIPLIIGRDVIHGFRTIFPIPIGLASTWNPDLVRAGARIAAVEAASTGIRWTFAPMMDITRDPRWGRIAETLGEDPYLASLLAVAMVRGFQSEDLSGPDTLAACVKHYAGYGAAEGGRDYNTTYIPEQLMRDLYLRPFEASVKAGAATLMTAFNDINGIPASGNMFLLREVLRGEWGFEGFVVSDWASVTQMVPHGYCADHREAAEKAALAGVDMEMSSPAYSEHLADLVAEGTISQSVIDDSVRSILRVKFALGLFDNPYTDPSRFPELVNPEHLAAAKESAKQSVVLLENRNQTLPLSRRIRTLAVIGPMADDPYEQLGTWVFDGKAEDSQTPLKAIRELVGGSTQVLYVKALETSRSLDQSQFGRAQDAARRSDAVVLFLGEESILSGEAHCRANIDLPGAQEELVSAISATGTPVIAVIMAGRPLTIGRILDKVDALLYSFHPGTMGGPALADLIFGVDSPSGRLPVTFPRVVGQIPIYYNHKNTGRPPQAETWVQMDKIPVRANQTSLGNESHYIDVGYTPQYVFGYGLTYTRFEYDNLGLSSPQLRLGGTLNVSVDVTNRGSVEATEIVQLYTRDLAASITRPVRELKGFQRIRLKPGETRRVVFELSSDQLSFHNPEMKLVTEPGKFHVWVAPNSAEGLREEFEVVP